MSRYEDDDLESVSTASCSDDDEIDNTAMSKMNCNFLQKQKSGYLNELVNRHASSVFSAVAQQHRLSVSPQQGQHTPHPPSLTGVNSKLKQKLEDLRFQKENSTGRASEPSREGSTSVGPVTSSMASTPTNADAVKTNRRSRLVTISSNGSMKKQQGESDANPIVSTIVHVPNGDSFLSASAADTNLSSLLSPTSTVMGDDGVLSPPQPPSVATTDSVAESKPEEVNKRESEPQSGEGSKVLDDNDPTPSEPETVASPTHRNSMPDETPKTPSIRPPTSTCEGQEVPVTPPARIGAAASGDTPAGSAIRCPTPPLATGTLRSPRLSSMPTANNSVMSPLFGDIPNSLGASTSGRVEVQQTIYTSLKSSHNDMAHDSDQSSPASLLTKEIATFIPVPAPPRRTGPAPPSPPHSEQKEEAPGARVGEHTATDDGGPPLASRTAAAPSLGLHKVHSATAIYSSAEAALRADDECDEAPLTARSDVESRDGESRCRDVSPPDTPSIYKREEEEEDTAGVVSPAPAAPPPAAGTSVSPGSNLRIVTQVPSVSPGHVNLVTWDTKEENECIGLGQRLYAQDSDVDGVRTPEVSGKTSPRLIKRGSSASRNNTPSRFIPSQEDENAVPVQGVPKIVAEDFDTSAASPTTENSLFSLQGLLNVSRPAKVSADDLLQKAKPEAESTVEANLPKAPRALSPALKHRRHPNRSVSRDPSANRDPSFIKAESTSTGCSDFLVSTDAGHTEAVSPHTTADGEDEEKHQPTKQELLKREKMLQDRVAALKKLVPGQGVTSPSPLTARTPVPISLSAKPPARVLPLTAR